ncbi:MAG: CRISPR-associated protein [Chloroflexi bacterium]|nr:CRISPR-associated protein [Chloroflexota bacterium]
MNWTNYKVVLRLLTPLHIGHVKLGNVQRTRHYVTGKALWGALTARLTRDYPELGGDYAAVGKGVNKELAFGYFYPTDDASGAVSVYPWTNPDDFAWRYLNTYASTALNYSRNSAEDGSLHETEFIAPTTRDNKPVYLVGHVFAKQGCELRWREALPRLQLGGERTYGWGRVAKHSCADTDAGMFEGWKVDLTGARPQLALDAETFLCAHASCDSLNEIQGRVEPLVGRITAAATAHGEAPRTAQICWAPGGRVNANVKLQIGDFGIWKGIGGQ